MLATLGRPTANAALPRRLPASLGLGVGSASHRLVESTRWRAPELRRLRGAPSQEQRHIRWHSSTSAESPQPAKPEADISKTGTGGGGSGEASLGYKMLESAATSLASIVMLAFGFGLAGYAYHRYYKHLVLRKMTLAFDPGDPVLELAALGRGVPNHILGGPVGVFSKRQHHADEGDSDDRGNYWIERPEQAVVNDIIAGKEIGHYHLFIGEKGTGKSSMQLEAMAQIDAEGVAMFDAHADLEIFRIRLGKALNFEFNEDYIGGYFSERGPRESTALLDIERALNKLEKVALRRRNAGRTVRRGDGHGHGHDHTHDHAARPLVMIVNQMHLIRDDEDGRDLIELLQQRAEQWAAAGLVTMVLNSDDYWVYERLKQLAARLEVHSIQDLARDQAIATLQRFRLRYFGEQVSDATAAAVFEHVGGRLTFLNRVARSGDMFRTCRRIVDAEKTWFLNQCWILGAEMDDDVMDQQKWAAAAMVLALALVDKEAAEATNGRDLPAFALHEAQQIMTRVDFVREMDRRNLFTIASDAQVRASSVPMQEALRQICGAPGFREHLEATIQRIADIESLGRTRELVAKDLVLGGHYQVRGGGSGSSACKEVRFRGWSPHERPPRPPPEEGER